MSKGSVSKIVYTDIGHRSEGDLLWVFTHTGKLDVRPLSEGTHNSIWGIRAMGMWRGRLEIKTGRLSIVPPTLHKSGLIPQNVRDALESTFGGGVDPIMFNPSKVKPHRLRW